MKALKIILGIVLVVFGIALVVFAFIAWSIFCLTQYVKELEPPEGASLDEFLASKTNVCCVPTIEVDGQTHTVVILRVETTFWKPFVVPSGPPVYVFDADKNLVDWCHDIGDDPYFMKKWNHFKHDPAAHGH